MIEYPPNPKQKIYSFTNCRAFSSSSSEIWISELLEAAILELNSPMSSISRSNLRLSVLEKID